LSSLDVATRCSPGHSLWLRALRRVAYHRTANRLLRTLLHPLAPWLSGRFLRRIPLVGRFEVPLATGDTVLFESRGGDGILRRLYWSRQLGFEESVQRVFARVARRSRTILDIGANTGLYTLLAARVNPTARIWAFEPLPAAFSALERNVHLNGLTQVSIERAALTDREGWIELHVPRSTRFIPTTASTSADFRPDCQILRVRATTLDDHVRRRGVEAVDLLKIDTEATEPRVLAGGRETLRRHRPLIVCEVLEGLTEDALEQVLAPLGYRYFWIAEEGPIETRAIEGHNRSAEANYLFVPEEKIDSRMLRPLHERRGRRG